MSIAIIYDLSRLITRVLNATPNGIDRVDWLLAAHFLQHRQFETIALRFGFRGPCLLPNTTSTGATDRVAAAWDAVGDGDQAYERVVERLCAPPASGAKTLARIVQGRPMRTANVAQALLRYGFARGRSPQINAPKNAIYFNASHFPLEWTRHVDWLDDRLDIRPVFMIHDVLPIDRPEWFWRAEPTRHALRLDLLARRGAAAVVASSTVQQNLEQRLDKAGRQNMPILRQALPVDDVFYERAPLDPRIERAAFFTVCGTIEPRKNHRLLLGIWRDLVKKYGQDAPKLLVVGKRGWNGADIIAALEDEFLRDHVIEVCGLPTRAYKRLLEHSLALLAPSFAEGFGLTVAEALAVGVPVIASDIPPFREQGGADVAYLDPNSSDEWRKAIVKIAEKSGRNGKSSGISRPRLSSRKAFLNELDSFLAGL
jgi:glycosyltransferase involved in cell wall biosynthesis